MVIKIPKNVIDNPRYAELVAMAGEFFVTPKELSERWGVSVDRLGQLRAQRKGAAWVKIAGGAVRYRLADVVAHERAGEGGPLSIDRLKKAVAALPDFSETQRAKVLAHLLSQLYSDE